MAPQKEVQNGMVLPWLVEGFICNPHLYGHEMTTLCESILALGKDKVI